MQYGEPMTNKSCEEYEVDLSSFLDGELPLATAAAAFEHALSCANCSRFYRAARRLESTSGARGDESTLDDRRAAELWQQVRVHTVPKRWQPTWRAAALLAVGLGGGYLLAALAGNGGGLALPSPSNGWSLAAANQAATMDEQRFVALASELLGSDRRYQRAMLEVLRLVPAIETGEGLRSDDGPRGAVRTRFESERPGTGAI